MNGQCLDALATAQRVLIAVAKTCSPDPTDVDKLRGLAPPLADLPLDELAAGVIQLAMEISGAAVLAGDRAVAEGKPSETTERLHSRV